ncbi:hypothetical protein F4808DRAFT_457204 [Astrocystis sublimbata]|nr:hypothetical protein F4808DRAFT_457204 [Astrocystis sublimbata]
MEFRSHFARQLTPFELKLVNENFPWVNTNTINATQIEQDTAVFDADGRPDRLGEHSHHGESAHHIIRGDLRIQRTHEPHLRYELSDAPGAQRQDQVPAGTLYRATSQRGASFVGGHRSLSPESAERFIARGSLQVFDLREDRELPSIEQLNKWPCQWLRQIRFNPDGKAHPDVARGEKPILDTKHVHPPMPHDIYIDLSEWFESEWRKSGEPKKTRQGRGEIRRGNNKIRREDKLPRPAILSTVLTPIAIGVIATFVALLFSWQWLSG